MIDPWLMLGAAALLLRAAFAIYVAGLSRSKNTASTLFRSVVEIAFGLLAWWAIGAAIHGSWQEIAHPVGSASLFIAATFLLPPAIVSGATVERSRSIVPIAAALLLPGLLTPILWKILQSNWLVTNGFIDEAGATFIHFSAGCAALVACIAVGPRIGKYNRDGSTNAIVAHNLPLASVGLLLIFIAWLPYVAGYASASPADAALNASLAAAAAVVAAFIYCAIRYGRQDIFLVYAALLGGLVSITAAPDLLTPSRAVFVGAVAGLIIPFAVVKLDMNFHVDDPAGGIAIHGIGGILGALAIALLQPGSFSQRFDHLGAQLIALIVVAVITLAAAGGVFFGLKLVTRIRCSEADEFEGLDLSEYDLNAYPDFQQTTIKSYHLREM
jgi:Amt family ammonium transporter